MELLAKKRIEFKSDLGGKPGFGTLGKKIQVYANHFPIKFPAKGDIFHYDIEIKEQPSTATAGGKDGKPPAKGGKVPQKPPAGRGAGGDAAAAAAGPSSAAAAPTKKAAGKIPKRLKRDIIQLWQDQNKAFFGNGSILGVYDGEKNFFTCKKLELKKGEEKEFAVLVPPDDAEGRREKTFTLLFKLAAELKLEHLTTALSTPSTTFPTQILVALQCVMREALARWCPVPEMRTFYFPEGGFDLGGDRGWSPKQAWPGIFMSLRPNLWKITLNLDISHTAMSKAQSFYDYYANYIWHATKSFNREDGCDVANPNSRVPDQNRRSAEREVYGCKVETQHSGIRRWRCIGFSARPLKDLDFALADGKRQKIVDYFKSQYGMTLDKTHLPAVKVGSQTAPKYLPMTICNIMPGQKMGRKLTEVEVATMVRNCAKPAPDRKRQVEGIRTNPVMTVGKTKKKAFEQTDNVYLKEFGISVEPTMPALDARILPVPPVGGSGIMYPVKADDATVDLGQSGKFLPYKSVALNNWIIINLSRERRLDNRALGQFLNLLATIGKDRLGTIAPAKNANDAATQTPPNKFIEFYNQLKKQYFNNSKPQLVMVIVPKKGCSEYAICKQFCDVQEGVKSQMIAADSLSKNIEKGLAMYVGNLLLKINAKLNGSNQVVAFSRLPPAIFGKLSGLKKLISTPTMIFGADVTHPSPGMASSTPSIAAVVASVDKFWSEYRARVRAQVHREEIIQDMEHIVRELFVEFKAINNRIPQQIVFFRDGVSEGQMTSVWVNEFLSLQKACRTIDPTFKPGITYIIVGKRHHTRLFPRNAAEAVGKAGNVAPGTIVDTGICHYQELDYYLCSHFGIQGTSRPAHYHVLHDDNDLDVDTLQVLSYYLCYNYQRCMRAVSVPAPAYYAHHVAFRARYHLSQVFKDDESQSSSALSTPEKRRQMEGLLAGYNAKITMHADTRNTQYFC